MECSDKTILMKVKTLRILKIREEKEQRYVISVLKIISCIHAHFKSSAGISSDFLWICLLDHGIQ